MTYYGACLLFFEASTPFLHIRWFMSQFGLDKSRTYFLNSILFAVVFFLCRILFGLTTVFEGFETLYQHKSQIEVPVCIFISIAAVLMNSLNIYWFSKIVKAAWNPKQ
jgi:hypothetical protein